MKVGTAQLPLHFGSAPKWLFERMVPLARQIALYIIEDFGVSDLLYKLSDPFWFQALGCVLGFDWHSSGLTTTTTGALKEGLKGLEKETGFFMAGGKGATSRKTPHEIEAFGQQYGFEAAPLVYASKMSAKVDSSALQDGYQLYHHNFIFTNQRKWIVVQQGMNEKNKMARRYHWISETVKSFVEEPQNAICCDRKETAVLNLIASQSQGIRKLETKLVNEISPAGLVSHFQKIDTLKLPFHHPIYAEDFDLGRLKKILQFVKETKPQDFEALLSAKGVGPKTLRALSLIAELIYGQAPSFRDPARFAFAHGGKDGYPFPVERTTYDASIGVLEKAVRWAKLGYYEEKRALKRLHQLTGKT